MPFHLFLLHFNLYHHVIFFLFRGVWYTFFVYFCSRKLKTMQQMKTISLKLVCLLCLCSILLLRADNGLLIPADQLPSSLINCITQDRYGLIWVGTDYGLSRYDGYHFTNYFHDAKDSTSLNSNTITAFLVDRDGNLWIGSALGLMRYDYECNKFIRFRFPGIKAAPRVYSLIENNRGDILVGTAGYGLFKVPHGLNTIRQVKGFVQHNYDDFFTYIYSDSRGYHWKGNHLEIIVRYIYKGGRYYAKTFRSPCGPPIAFLPDGGNGLLIVCMKGIARYDYGTGRLSEIDYDYGSFPTELTINTAIRSYRGDLYLGTTEHGVLVIRRGSRKVTQYDGTSSPVFDIKTADISSLYEDKDHNIWVGCYSKGLYLINNVRYAFHNWSLAWQGYPTGNSVSSMARGAGNDVWCTVQNSGVYHFDPDGKIIGHPAAPSGARQLLRARDGQYWLGTNSAVYRYNPVTGTASPCVHFDSFGVYSMVEGSDGKLYISAYSKGLYVYDPHTGTTTNYNMRMRSPQGFLCNDWVRCLKFDHRGLLWIATSNGVSCFDPRTKSFKPLGWDVILQGVVTDALEEDAQGNIVIGTDNGLYLYNYSTRKTMRFPHGGQLIGKQVSAIVKDLDGNLWISTTMGLWQYDRSKNTLVGYLRGYGLSAHEYMLGSQLHTADGRIAFGTSDGITIFYPQEVNASVVRVGQPHLTAFIVDGRQEDFRKTDFSVPYSENSFTLEFSQLDYKYAKETAYRYRVNGGRWQTNEEGNNSILFSHMEPGDYRIEVMADYNGVASAKPVMIHVVVNNPWYSSWWAWLIYIAILVAIVWSLYRAAERKRKVDDDEQKMRFLIDATHDIRSPLTLILGPLKKLQQRITNEEDRNELDAIDHNAQRLLVLVNQILDERKIDKGQMRLHCEETDLIDFAAQSMRLYQYGARERSIALTLTDGDDKPVDIHHKPVKVWIDRVNFDKVIANLLSNALKYTFDGGAITLSVAEDNDSVKLRVTDTGPGFKEEKPDRLFERFYQSRATNILHIQGTGIGLNLCRNIVQMHGGSITAFNRTDGQHGACFEVTLRKGNSHLQSDQIVAAKEEKETHTEGARGSRRILVADDDFEIPAYIARELGQTYRVDSAQNGKVALEKVLSGNYSLVISDIMMPEMDGIALLKAIKQNPRTSDIPVVLLTSQSEVGNRLEGLKKGADAFIAKPFDIDELRIVVNNLLENVRRLRGKFSGALEQKDKMEDVRVRGNDDALMERVMRCINEHITEQDFNVEHLAEEVGISRAQLHRKMKEITGVTTSDFIRNLRLEQAARLLQEGNVNVTQVAYAVGFNNQTHFSNVFKKHYGVSPTAYAQQHKTPPSGFSD